MEKEIEQAEVQENKVEEVVEAVEEKALTQEELDDLKDRADKSSQNYERNKKTQKENEELAAKIEQLETKLATSDDDLDPIEDDKTKTQIADLTAQLASMQEKSALDGIYADYPVLKDKLEEFDEFKQGYPTTDLDKVAKLYLIENDLYDEKPKRKGLEKARGGQKTTPPTGNMSAEDAERLRKSDSRKYKEMLLSGKLDDID